MKSHATRVRIEILAFVILRLELQSPTSPPASRRWHASRINKPDETSSMRSCCSVCDMYEAFDGFGRDGGDKVKYLNVTMCIRSINFFFMDADWLPKSHLYDVDNSVFVVNTPL